MRIVVACWAACVFSFGCGGGRTPMIPGLFDTGGFPGAGGQLGGGRGGAGVSATGGISGGAGNTVTFLNGRAEGAMTGYGWLAVGDVDTLSSPLCSDGQHATSYHACKAYRWSSRTELCMSGNIPAVALPNDVVQPGFLLGVNSTDPAGRGLGGSFRAMSLDLTGTPETGVAVVVHRVGDPDAVRYCATLRRGSSVVFTAFNTSCRDGLGVALAESDVPNLNWIGIQIPATQLAITVNDLCLSRIVFE